MGILLSAMAAAGDAGVNSMDQNIKQQNLLDAENLRQQNSMVTDQRRSELETQKAKVLADYAEGIKNAPLNRFTAIAQQKMGEAVPVTAAPVTTLSGNDPNQSYAGEAADGKGLDPSHTPNMIERIKALPDDNPDKAGMLAQLQRQSGSDNQTAQDSVAGQTRKMTATEATEAALAAVKANDLQAYIAAKAALGDKYLTVPDNASLIDTTTGKVAFSNTGGRDLALEREDRKDARSAADIDSREKIAQSHIDAVLKSKEVNQADVDGTAKMIASGKAPALSSFATGKPLGAAIMARVYELNPDYDAKTYPKALKAEKDFDTGKQGNSVRSFNVSVAHLETLDTLADALNNGNAPLINKLGNAYAQQTGGTAPTNFNAAKKIVADEIVKAIVGGGGGVHDREEAAKVIDAANSPAQLKGVISTYKELMVGQLVGLRDQYKATTGRTDFETKYLSDASRGIIQKKIGGASPSAMPDDIADIMNKYK